MTAGVNEFVLSITSWKILHKKVAQKYCGFKSTESQLCYNFQKSSNRVEFLQVSWISSIYVDCGFVPLCVDFAGAVKSSISGACTFGCKEKPPKKWLQQWGGCECVGQNVISFMKRLRRKWVVCVPPRLWRSMLRPHSLPPTFLQRTHDKWFSRGVFEFSRQHFHHSTTGMIDWRRGPPECSWKLRNSGFHTSCNRKRKNTITHGSVDYIACKTCLHGTMPTDRRITYIPQLKERKKTLSTLMQQWNIKGCAPCNVQSAFISF